jgi:hypothetical protein
LPAGSQGQHLTVCDSRSLQLIRQRVLEQRFDTGGFCQRHDRVRGLRHAAIRRVSHRRGWVGRKNAVDFKCRRRRDSCRTRAWFGVDGGVRPPEEDGPASIRRDHSTERGQDMMPIITANTNAEIPSHSASPTIGAALVGIVHSCAVVFGREHWRVDRVLSTVAL